MEKFYQENDVEILAVNLTPTESSVSDVTEFIDEFGLSFQVLLDEELAVSSRYGIQPVPTSFMLIQTVSFSTWPLEPLIMNKWSKRLIRWSKHTQIK